MTTAMGFPGGSAERPGSGTLTPTGYALLGLLMFAGRTDTAVTAYELKQRADRTLRYYWVAPAMSQVYSEVTRLVAAGLVAAVHEDEPDGAAPAGRRTTRYVITDDGERVLRDWLTGTPADFPVLKHPVALRLLMGHLSDPETVRTMLDDYVTALAEHRRDLAAVREMLGDREEVRYPAMVADWGLAYYDAEARIVADLRERVGDAERPADPSGA
ncbi:PadR family transcriptional regulator [Cellulomonas hominis]|uniref:PadR family transcriptional regulator n=1 Tax=Cellulomonas hominis TaxID=156981 RepID=UPI001BCC820D|nr:PadR family transcriptional regulator [Cellulomonas hominis]